MLIGPDWLITHLRKLKTQGNTAEGRAIVRRVKAESATVTFRCDVCGVEEITSMGNRLRYIVRRSFRQELRFGKHLCGVCVLPYRNETLRQTKASPAYKDKVSGKPSWQSRSDALLVAAVHRRAAATRKATAAKKSPEERARGVRKQWALMPDDVKQERARKIGEASRARWAAMTPEERSAHVKKMIRGLPRSSISDDFKGALVRENLYDGFTSEVAISGFVADEVNVKERLIIEFYGDYYHCNPRIYTDPDFFNTTTHMTAAEKWKYDRRRLAAFRKNGYHVLVVWESDWRSDPVGTLEAVRRFRFCPQPG